MVRAKLYLVHCGYYDTAVCEGLFESHINLFVVAESFEAARGEAKKSEVFQKHRMHVDGLQEIQAVQGFEIHLHRNSALEDRSIFLTNKHRDLAPKPN